jgi:CheY-like chemotaxis protein
LIVDDSVLNLLGLKCQLNQINELRNQNQAIDEALNGEEAVALFKKRIDLCIESNWIIKPYRIIFIDYNMPVCDGPSAVA